MVKILRREPRRHAPLHGFQMGGPNFSENVWSRTGGHYEFFWVANSSDLALRGGRPQRSRTLPEGSRLLISHGIRIGKSRFRSDPLKWMPRQPSAALETALKILPKSRTLPEGPRPLISYGIRIGKSRFRSDPLRWMPRQAALDTLKTGPKIQTLPEGPRPLIPYGIRINGFAQIC